MDEFPFYVILCDIFLNITVIVYINLFTSLHKETLYFFSFTDYIIINILNIKKTSFFNLPFMLLIKHFHEKYQVDN